MHEYILRLIIAGIIGFTIGLVNNVYERTKSSRVFAIICIGAALIAITGLGIYKNLDIVWVGDPSRLLAQIISALGFLGTGMIWVTRDKKVMGISNAASLWLTAVLGVLVGIGLIQVSIIGGICFVIIYKISPFISINNKDEN